MSYASTVPLNPVTRRPDRPLPGDHIVCGPSTNGASFEAQIIASVCFHDRGQACRRYSAVVRDLRRLFDADDLLAGRRRGPRNLETARNWVHVALTEPDSPLRLRPRWMGHV